MMAASSSDVDFLDEIFMVEERLHEDGYKEGYKAGAETGYHQGYAAGKQKAAQFGAEMGFYLGCTKAWTAVLEREASSGNARKLRSLAALMKVLDSFKVDEINNESYWDEITTIRAKFKQVSSLLKISTEFVEQAATSGLSF